MKFESLKRPTIKEVFINKMESMILSGELPVGEKLPSERAMAEEMNISKTAVHDGLKDLERFGFCQIGPQAGYLCGRLCGDWLAGNFDRNHQIQ